LPREENIRNETNITIAKKEVLISAEMNYVSRWIDDALEMKTGHTLIQNCIKMLVKKCEQMQH